MIYKTLMAAAVLATLALPAYADVPDNVTLTIENDAGSVTTVPGMTGRECDGVVALLIKRKSAFSVSGTVLSCDNCALWAGNQTLAPSPPLPHTSVITSAKCMTPTEKKQ